MQVIILHKNKPDSPISGFLAGSEKRPDYTKHNTASIEKLLEGTHRVRTFAVLLLCEKCAY